MRVSTTKIATSVSLALVVLAGCSKEQPGGHMGGMPPPEVAVVKVTPQNLPVVFEYVGQTAGSKEVEVRGRVTGILEKRLYEEGAAVKAGQPLFLIDPKPFEAQAAAAEADVASAEAKLAQARREATRLKPLIEQKAVSQKEYDDAVSTEQLSAAALKSAQARLTEARLNLGYTHVNAPVAGITSKAQKSEGSLVQAGGDSLLTTLVQIDPIYVNFSISEDDQLRLDHDAADGKVKLPDGGKFKVNVRLADGSMAAQAGKLNFRDAHVNTSTGTYDARAELPNANGKLAAGQFVRVLLSGGERPNALAVPQRAVIESGQGKLVFLVGKGKDGAPIAQPQPVEVGEWVDMGKDRGWIIRSGLKGGEEVIVDGLPKLRPGAPVKPVPLGAAPAAAPAAQPKA